MTAPQAKFFINDVLKAYNQAIGRSLYVVMKILARDKKGRGVSSKFQRVGWV